MRIIDLSAPIRPSPPETPEPLRTEPAFSDHVVGAAAVEALFGVKPELLRDGEGWATEEFLRFGTHDSTHVDAPWHYNSTIDGARAQTIDELPLEWFFAPGVVLDFTGHADGEAVTSGRRGVFWSAHQVGLSYCQIERLCNLGELPSTGFRVACFPLRIEGASAGPARAVAITGE